MKVYLHSVRILGNRSFFGKVNIALDVDELRGDLLLASREDITA